MKKGILTFLFFISCSLLFAQYFSTGQDPASIHWRQINTLNFQLIYPSDFEKQAQKMAYVLEKVYEVGGSSLNNKPKKVSVIFHTHTVRSNGLLALAPKRVELYTTPHQSIYPQDWLEQLAIHEFRHVVQVDKIEQQLPGIIKIILGEQGAALVVGAYLPFWLLEGDAVIVETALSNFGRGRLPSFLMEYKALLVEKQKYSIEKAYLGSFKDFVPNHYEFGYLFTGEIRNRFGKEVWEQVFHNVGARPLSITPLDNTLKQLIGLNQKLLYEQVFDSLKTECVKSDTDYIQKYNSFTNKGRTYTNYQFNHYLQNNQAISYKTSFEKISRFVLISENGNEKTLHIPGNIFDESVSYTDNLIVWSEQTPDIRWSHSGRSLIRIYDIDNESMKKFIPVYKSFSPSISVDKNKIALIEVDSENNYYLSVYNLNTGEILIRYQASGNNYMFTPRWEDNDHLLLIVLTDKGKRLASFNIDSEELVFLTNSGLGEIKHPVEIGDNILFISSYEGENSLYALNKSDHSVFQVYKARFGVEYPAVSPDSSKILLSNYTSNGFELIEIPFDQDTWKPIEELEKYNYSLAENLASGEDNVLNFTGKDSAVYESEKYNKIEHLFQFHSWAPLFINTTNDYDIQPGISVMSQNKLGTAETILGYKWDVEQKTGSYYGNFIYRGWYPVFQIELTSNKRASEYGEIIKKDKGQQNDTIFKRYTWKELTFEFDAGIPFNLTKGKYYRLFKPEIKFTMTSLKQDQELPFEFKYGNIHSLTYRIYYHQILKQSYQDLIPNFGIVLDLMFRHTPLGDFDFGSISSAQMINYFPGILPNHGFRAYYAYQKKIKSDYSYSDAIRYPRGWNSMQSREMYSLSFDYLFPLCYPDYSLGRFIYLKRLKASLYGDFAQQEIEIFSEGKPTGTQKRKISSFGVELKGDMHFLRFYAPVELGFRTGYLPEVSQMHFAFLFNIDFTSF